jgi:ABC-type multidrug transport system fused ATPase/permease subunit
VRDITPAEYARFFGNGLATTGETIRENPELVEKFGAPSPAATSSRSTTPTARRCWRIWRRATRRRARTPPFAAALFDAVRSKTIPVDDSQRLGYQPPEVWEEWQDEHDRRRRSGRRRSTTSTAAYTNDFVEKLERGPELMAAQPPRPLRAAAGEAVYELTGVGKTYARNAVHALEGITLTLTKGSFSSVIGSSGCGKSTLLKIMAGLIPPTEGRVVLPASR